MADHTINIDVYDISVPELNPINIAIINLPNPVIGYSANAKEVRDLIQIPKYTIYESGTSNVISGTNYFDYFPEEGGGGGGGGVTPEEVQTMIDSSMNTLAPVASSGDYDDLIDKPVIDSATSTESTNAIQNKGITNFVNSSIETATATFRGTYTTIKALNAAAGDKNDYAFYNHADAAGNTVFDRYKFVPTEQADLPEGYTQLEYIESSGTQYIDTGVLPTSKRRISIKFNPLSYAYATYFFGMTGYSNRGYSDPYYLNSDNGSGRFLIDGVSAVVSLDFPGVNEFEYNYPYITLNGDSANIGDPGEWYYSAGGPTIYLFALNYRGSVSNHSIMRLYGCKLYDTDGVTLIRDFVPCKNASNIAGLYDVITNAFYPNKGTGSFIAGPQANGYWEYEYTLNNSSFTADQWATINSGITSSDKTQIATNTNDISSLNTNKLDKTGTAAKATADSAGNNIITTYAKKTDLNDIACTYRGTYTTAEALNAASGDKNDFAFLKTTDSAGNEIYSRYRRVEIPQVVPEGYTQLMYITSNGTQHIDTGVQAKRDLKTYIKFTRKNGGNNQFFGVYENNLYYALWFSDWRWQLWCGIGRSSVDVSSASSGVTEYLIEYPTVTVNDTAFNFSTQSDFTSEKTIYLCAVNGESNKSIIDLYECIIYDDDKTTELKHFYPCKNSSNVCGMYETVEGVFYPDANGGNFAAGPQANGYWNFEYSIPGNLFSSTQFAALNSGINTTKVDQITTNKNNISSIDETIDKNNGTPIEVTIEYSTNMCPKDDGTFYTDTAYKKTWFGSDYVEIPEGVEKIEYRGIEFNNGTIIIVPIAFYDENKTFISSAPAPISGTFGPTTGTIYVPYDAKYYYQSEYYADGDTKNSYNYTKYIYSAVWGKEASDRIGTGRVLCIGDSLTAGTRSDTSQINSRNYPFFMSDVLSNQSEIAAYPGYSARMVWNQNKIQNDVDFTNVSMIIIMLGTNGGLTDTLDTDVLPYTSYTDYADTQTGCYCKIIEYCMAQAPNVTIFLCTTPYFDNVKNPQFDPPTTPNANAVIPKIAELYNLSIIDVRHNMGINAKNTAYYQEGDGLHGTEAFYKRLGHLIGTEIKSKCSYVD